MKKRQAQIKRKTKETDISLKVNIDGSGKSKINTGIGILNHMLELFAFHGLMDLEINAKGDLKVDMHHTNEDIGIVLGQAIKKALGDKKGIRRFGSASVPMEEVIANVVLDISGRATYTFACDNLKAANEVAEGYALKDAGHFFEGLAKQLGINLNIKVSPVSEDLHTTLEPIFKALGIALDQATQVDPRRKCIPSTKGVID
ncbi:MAG: imidazoleglycerol-phosphate dehydratase HisB [Candidatus Omnitrophica bacterium]|nr:imidazoleglycerol-phosphate dehydratase HisB [Candidatus Omnitrophota bacterium]